MKIFITILGSIVILAPTLASPRGTSRAQTVICKNIDQDEKKVNLNFKHVENHNSQQDGHSSPGVWNKEETLLDSDPVTLTDRAIPLLQSRRPVTQAESQTRGATKRNIYLSAQQQSPLNGCENVPEGNGRCPWAQPPGCWCDPRLRDPPTGSHLSPNRPVANRPVGNQPIAGNWPFAIRPIGSGHRRGHVHVHLHKHGCSNCEINIDLTEPW